VYVGGYARKLGFSVKIVDAYNDLISSRKVLDLAAGARPDIVGITCDATRFDTIRLLFKHLRERLPGVLLVAGGSFPSFRQKDLFPWVDVIVKGEGEASFSEIADNFLKKKALEGIKGVFLKAENDYVYSGDRAPILALDDYFYPAWDLVNMRNNYFFWGRKAPVATIVTSRGCPENCAYCALPPLWGHRHRQVSAPRVVEELALLRRDYLIREVYIKDNLFTFNKAWVTAFCEGLLKKNLKLSWSCGTGVKYVTPEILALMKKAGCHTINYGFESGNQQILDSVDKAITVEQSIKAAEMTKKAGIHIFGFFMIGFPGETRGQIEDTISLAKKISPNIMMCAMVTPFPGTRIWYSLGLDKISEGEWAWRDYNWYERGRSLSSVPPRELTELRAKAMRSVRTFGYWVRYMIEGDPMMLLRQVWRIVWTYKIYLSPKYRGIRKDIPKGVF
jgi:radical SAM superfamily enzyme YgiQ (UPF0313 family)